MRENSEVIGDLFKKAWTPKPEISLLSQRQLSKLPMVQVVAVDPRNPHEIDDAFRVIKRPNRSMDVSVVFPRAGLIPFTSPEFNEALDNGWSVYPGDDKYIPMISNVDLVTKQLSLIEGELTPGVELSFQLTSKGNTINAGIRHVAVDTKQIVYEDYGHQLRNGEHSKVIQAVNLIRKGRNRPALNPRKFRNNGYTPDKKYSSEERYARNIVQELMIHANKTIGQFAITHNIAYPYRFTQLARDVGDIGIEPGTESSLDIVRAYYSHKPTAHEFLDTDKYTHSTSPLRRFMDLFGHNILEFILLGGSNHDINKSAIKRSVKHINEIIDKRSLTMGSFDV